MPTISERLRDHAPLAEDRTLISDAADTIDALVAALEEVVTISERLMSSVVEPKLPGNTEQLAGWADLSPAWATIERGPDGTVYFVTWLYGSHSVLFAVHPDGTVWAKDDD